MATRSNNFVTRFRGDDKNLQRAFGRTSKGFSRLKSGAMGVAKGVAGVGVAAAAAAAGIALLGRRWGEQVDHLAKAAGRYQLMVKETQALKQASELNGTTLEATGKAMLRLVKATGDAGSGLKESIRAFDDAGLSFAKFGDVLNRDRLMAFEIAVKAVADMKDAGKQGAAGTALLGKNWAALVAAFEKNPQVFTERRQMLERLGLAMSETGAKSVEAMTDAFSEVGYRFDGFGQQLMGLLSGPIATFTQGFTKAIDDWAMSLGGYDEAAKVVAGNIGLYFDNALAKIQPTIDAINSAASFAKGIGEAHTGAVDATSAVIQSMAGAIPGTIAYDAARPEMPSPTLQENEKQTRLLQDMRDRMVQGDGLVLN